MPSSVPAHSTLISKPVYANRAMITSARNGAIANAMSCDSRGVGNLHFTRPPRHAQ